MKYYRIIVKTKDHGEFKSIWVKLPLAMSIKTILNFCNYIVDSEFRLSFDTETGSVTFPPEIVRQSVLIVEIKEE